MPVTQIVDSKTGQLRPLTEEESLEYNKSPDEIRNGTVQTDQEIIDQSINGLSTAGAGFATSTNLGTDYIKSLVNAGLISDQEQKQKLADISAQRKSSLERNIEAGRFQVHEQFQRKIAEAEEIGKIEVSMARAVVGRAQGGDMGYDSALMGAIQSVEKGARERIYKLESERREAMANLDYNKAQQLDTILNDEADNLNQFYKESWAKKLDVIGLIDNQEKMKLTKLQMDWDYVSKLKSGKTWISPYTGISYTGTLEDELSNAEWINVANNIPMGTTQTMTINGKEYTISGIGKPDMNTSIYESEDANGYVSYTIIDTAKALSDPDYKPKVVSAGKIGKGFKGTEEESDTWKLTTDMGTVDLTKSIDPVLLNKIVASNIPQELVKNLAVSILGGADLEDIRTALRNMKTELIQYGVIKEGEDPISVLDKFDSIINIEQLRKGEVFSTVRKP